MTSHRRPLALLVFVLLVSDVTKSYVIRPSRPQDELSEALRIIQNARSKLLERTQYQPEDPTNGYYYPENPDDEGGNLFDELIDDAEASQFVPDDAFNADDATVNDEEQGLFADDVGDVAEPATEAVKDDELKSIFNDDDEKTKDDDKREYDPTTLVDKKDGEGEGKNELSPGEVNKLLETAEHTEMKVMSGAQGEGGKGVVKQVVIKGEPAEDGQEKMTMKEDEWLITPEKTLHRENSDEAEVPMEEVNKEWLLPAQGPAMTSVKRKRSRATTDGELVPEELERLREFIDLEDEENTYLANALNLATMSQVARSDKFIPLEVKYLRKAIEDEEEIQKVKESLDELETEVPTDEDFLDEDAEEMYPPENEKIEDVDEQIDDVDEQIDEVGDPDEQIDEIDEQLDDDVVQGNVVDDEDTIESNMLPEDDVTLADAVEDYEAEEQDEINNLLATKLRTFLTKMRQAEVDEETATEDDVDVVNDEVDDETGGRWLNYPVDPEDEGISDESDEYLPPEEDDEDDVDPAMLQQILDEDEMEVCPAVAEFTDGCSAVRTLEVGLDREAVNLCDRHQLCYACGAFYGLGEETCDHGYLLEADRLCQGDEECRNEAAALFVLMQSTHAYTPFYANSFSCANKCTLDYITNNS